MPTYKITDPATGKSVRITGDAPPDGKDIEEIFSHVQANTPQKTAPATGADFGASAPEGTLSTLLKPLEVAGNVVDRVSYAPLKAGLSAAMDVAQSDPEASTLSQLPMGLAAFARGAAGQFGRDPSLAPNGKEMFARAGLSTDPIQRAAPSGMMGFGNSYQSSGAPLPSPAGLADFAASTFTPIPGAGMVGGIAKVGVREAGPLARMAAKGTGRAIEGAAKVADAATGTKLASGTFNVAKDVVSGTKDAAKSVYRAVEKTYGGKYDPEFKRLASIAEKAGIDPNELPKSIKFGKNSVASKQQRHSMEAFGADEADKFDATLSKVQDAVRKEISDIGSGAKITGGKPLGTKPIPATKYEAGERIKAAYDGSVESYFKDLDVSYHKLGAENPGMQIPPEAMQKFQSKLDETADYANKLIKNSFDDVSQAQGQQLLKAVERAKQSTGNYADFVDALQGVGRTSFKVKNTMAAIPPDVAKFRKLYGDMSELAVSTVRKNLGKDVAEDLLTKNKEMHQLFGDKNILAQLGEVTKSPDKMVDAIMADPLRIKTIKKYLPEEEIQALKGRVLQDLIKENTDGEFTFKSLDNALKNKAKKESFSALFDAGELKDFQDLIELGDKFGPKQLSTSGTGASNQITGLVSKVAGAAGKPIQMVGSGVEKALAVRQEAAAAKGAAKASKRAAPGPGMNFDGGPTLNSIRGMVSGSPRSKVSQMYYENKNNSERK